MSGKEKLQRVPRGAHEIAQDGHVWPIGADTPRIDGQSEPLGQIQIHARVIQLRKTESLRGQHTVQPRRIHWPGRPAPPPRASRHLVELLPIVFAPGRHGIFVIRSNQIVGCAAGSEGSPDSFLPSLPAQSGSASRAIHILHNGLGKVLSSPIVSNTLRGQLFLGMMRQKRAGSVFLSGSDKAFYSL